MSWEADRFERIARELADCRARGIERIDIRSHNQTPVVAFELERLADGYASARGMPRQGRVAQIKGLLREALASLEDSDPDNAGLIRALFFGSEVGRVSKSSSDLLNAAQRVYGESSASRFREIRRTAFRSFAGFLIDFAETAGAVDSRHAPSPDGQRDGAGAVKHGQTSEDREHLLFRLYIPSERLYAAEAYRLLSLFHDWLETVRGFRVRQSGYRTSSGQMFEFFADTSVVRSDLREEFDRFSNFLALCAEQPSVAAGMDALRGTGQAFTADFVARVGREVRRLQRDITHERERRMLDIQHSIEEELVDAGVELRAVPRAQIRAMIESLVPGPSASDSLALLAAPKPVQMTTPVTVNIEPQIIYAVESTIIHKVQGTVNLGPQAKELLALIDHFGGQDVAILQSALYELEDAAAPPTARSRSTDRLKKFLRELPRTAKEVGVSILEKYIEQKLGLGV